MKVYNKWMEPKHELPDVDEYVIWHYESGWCFYDAIDKDGHNPANYVSNMTGRCTHWMRQAVPTDVVYSCGCCGCPVNSDSDQLDAWEGYDPTKYEETLCRGCADMWYRQQDDHFFGREE